MRIKFLGTYSGESKNHKLVTFVVDDIIAVEAASLASTLTYQEQKQIKTILLSHCHYDHIRDLPAFAFNSAQNISDSCPEILALPGVLESVKAHFFDGKIYPDFTGSNSYLGKPSIRLRPIEVFKEVYTEGYQVVALPVNHNGEAVGYSITSKDMKTVFYTGDTGVGLRQLWEHVTPQLIIAETTFPNRLKQVAADSGHLCPEMLKQEMQEYRNIKGYVPRVILVHLNPGYESEIRSDVDLEMKDSGIAMMTARDGDTLII